MSGRRVGAKGLLMALSAAALLAAAPAPPPPAVLVAPIELRNVAPAYDFIGRVTAIQSVQIVPRITAFIEAEPAAQGAEVKAGEVLFQLQKPQYQAALQSAQAQLDSANAALRNAQVAYTRSAQLNKQGFEAQANLDQATATRDQDQANVLGAQAGVAQAGLNLSYATIVSPIDGRIGAISLTKGNLVTPSTPALATVNQMDPIRVVFSVSDRVLVGVEQSTGSNAAQIAAGLVVGLKLPDGSTYKQTGKISFLDNQVDPQTGTVSVYADFPNPDRLLLPGSFVSVDVRSAKPEEHPMVPVAAVQTDQGGGYVLTVGTDGTVHQQSVVLGRQIAQDFIVSKGLSGGERVIVEGIQKVRPGEKVSARTAPAPSAPAGG
ncbi:MAG: efflux RND transporter periplasmic adaptor subunit [Acetobacteraceae bacterium]